MPKCISICIIHYLFLPQLHQNLHYLDDHTQGELVRVPFPLLRHIKLTLMALRANDGTIIAHAFSPYLFTLIDQFSLDGFFHATMC
jgi:hypothetical protein